MAEVGMTSLLDKRVRGDMIATYRIMTGKGKVDPRTFFDKAEEGAGPRTRLVTGVHNTRETRSRQGPGQHPTTSMIWKIPTMPPCVLLLHLHPMLHLSSLHRNCETQQSAGRGGQTEAQE